MTRKDQKGQAIGKIMTLIDIYVLIIPRTVNMLANGTLANGTLVLIWQMVLIYGKWCFVDAIKDLEMGRLSWTKWVSSM